MANPVMQGLCGLTRFSGRDARSVFWPYAGVVIAGVFLGGGLAIAWAMEPVFRDMARFAAEHPEATTVQAAPGHYSISIDGSHPDAPVPDLARFFSVLAGIVGLAIALLAASVSRRLHDIGRRGWWGLLPVPFLAFGMIAFPIMIRDITTNPTPNLGLFFAIFASNVVYMLALATLVVLLCLRGAPGPNRFGEAPAT